ncbi:hypothetical protein R1sor_005775 [Riccia sorocarpa]|uniref:Endonuclease/exonuclease/phosphatase domain-containing protein n=1 Tax=Riccia sorocarpa TaxID=122646 RepID=A0ABD3HNY7_9MARC
MEQKATGGESLVQRAQTLQNQIRVLLGTSSSNAVAEVEGQENEDDIPSIHDSPAVETLAPPCLELESRAWADVPEDELEAAAEGKNEAPKLQSPHCVTSPARVETHENLERAIDPEGSRAGTSPTALNIVNSEREHCSGQVADENERRYSWQGELYGRQEQLTFNAKKLNDPLAVDDSQKKKSTWKRRGADRKPLDPDDTIFGDDTLSGTEDDDPSNSDREFMREDPLGGLGSGTVHKGTTRPAENSDSTPDRGNLPKKRIIHDPKSYHKQLLFLQEIGGSWLSRNLGSEEPREEEEVLPDHEGDEEVLPLQSPTDISPEILEDATGQEDTATSAELSPTLKRVMPRSTAIVDYKTNGDGDAVLLVHDSLIIREKGVSGSGFAAWARIQTEVGVLGILSLHAPNDSRTRKEVWTWLRNLVGDDRWIILGDFNMVETQQDSIGPSPVLKSDEKHVWDLCAGRIDLIDARLCASRSVGPHFTRQAWHGNRFDQSRFDRFYLSKRGEWVYHIRSVEHQGARALSDHVPIKLEVILKETEVSGRQRRSYFKMEHKKLMKVEVLERARTIWQDHPSWARDKRKRWSLALGRIRKLLMEVRDVERRREEEGGPLEERVEKARRRVEYDHSAEAKAEFEEAFTLLRQKEHEEAECNRRRCKITWLKEGDAPSKYFFARLKAKHAQEEITALEVNGGNSIEDRDGILEEVHRFYDDLYTAEIETECTLENRRRVVGRIDNRLTMEQNQILEEIPSEEFITSIVMEMPKEKSPGIDGVMIEILRVGWEFMREECFQMVQGFWAKKKL